MGDMIQTLKNEFLNKEVKLLNLDNFCAKFKNDNVFHNSIFENNYEEHLEEGTFNFISVLDDDVNIYEYVIIEFQVISGHDVNDLIVKVIDIYTT